jgi:Flp pilus assembly protein CpaB
VTRRGRAASFAALAAICAGGSAAIASSYRDDVEGQLGSLRPVVSVVDTLPSGRRIAREDARAALEVREIPERFAPIDAIASPADAVGRRPAAPIPAGSYLLVSQLRAPGGGEGGKGGERPSELAGDLRPVEIEVAGAEALASSVPPGGLRVDVVVAREPTATSSGAVDVAATGVRLLALDQAESTDPASSASVWVATLAVTRAQALKLIEAENFAREVRLIPR